MLCLFGPNQITPEINVIFSPITGLHVLQSEIAQAVQRLMARVTGACWTTVQPGGSSKRGPSTPGRQGPCWKIVPNKGPRVTGSLHVSPNDCCFFFQDSIYFDWTWGRILGGGYIWFQLFEKKLPNKDCWAGIRHFVSDSIFRLVFFVGGPQWSPLQ